MPGFPRKNSGTGFWDDGRSSRSREMVMNILLAAPRFTSRPGQYYEFPLWLCYLAGSLKAAGIPFRKTSNLESSSVNSISDGSYT